MSLLEFAGWMYVFLLALSFLFILWVVFINLWRGGDLRRWRIVIAQWWYERAEDIGGLMLVVAAVVVWWVYSVAFNG